MCGSVYVGVQSVMLGLYCDQRNSAFFGCFLFVCVFLFWGVLSRFSPTDARFYLCVCVCANIIIYVVFWGPGCPKYWPDWHAEGYKTGSCRLGGKPLFCMSDGHERRKPRTAESAATPRDLCHGPISRSGILAMHLYLPISRSRSLAMHLYLPISRSRILAMDLYLYLGPGSLPCTYI